MAGKRKERRKGMPELPVNSFADIAFLLIVFFVVASTLTQTRGVVSEIPSGEKSEAKEDKNAIVQLYTDKITLNDAEISVAGLRKSLAEMKLHEKHADDRIILLESKGDVDYQTYYSAMTAISAAGGMVAIIKESSGE